MRLTGARSVLEINGRPMRKKGDYFAQLGPVFERDKRLECRVWRPAGRRGSGSFLTVTVAPVVRQQAGKRERRVLFR